VAQVNILFYLILFNSLIRTHFLPVPLLRLVYLALGGARLGHNTYSAGAILDPPLTYIGNNCIIGHDAVLFSHAIENRRLSLSAISLAQAILTASLTITSNAGAPAVVTWSPDGTGSVGGSIGGTVESDPYRLNKTLSQFLAGSNQLDDLIGVFRMTTGILPAGIYNVTAEQSERVSVVSQVALIPESATLALQGVGLAGIGFVSRCRKQV
jgi:hypothetical protein